MRQLGILAVLAIGLSIGCSAAQPPAPARAADPTLERKTHLPTCRWTPVAPEWQEPCDVTNSGAKIEVTLREDNRPESAKKQTATCECN